MNDETKKRLGEIAGNMSPSKALLVDIPYLLALARDLDAQLEQVKDDERLETKGDILTRLQSAANDYADSGWIHTNDRAASLFQEAAEEIRAARAERDRLLGLVTTADPELQYHREYVEMKELRAERDRLREALQQLVDFQNGCPLPSYEKGWGKAMELAGAALAAKETK